MTRNCMNPCLTDGSLMKGDDEKDESVHQRAAWEKKEKKR